MKGIVEDTRSEQAVPVVPDRQATERSVPVILQKPNVRVIYSHVRADRSYRMHAAPSFNLVLQRAPDYWILRDVETGIFGQGDDALAVVRDFERAAEQHLDVLERQDALSEELSWQLEYLRARVQR